VLQWLKYSKSVKICHSNHRFSSELFLRQGINPYRVFGKTNVHVRIVKVIADIGIFEFISGSLWPNNDNEKRQNSLDESCVLS